MLQRVEQVNRRGMKRPCEGVRDLPVFHTEWLRWKEDSACSEGVRQVAEQHGNRHRCAEGSDGGPSASPVGAVEEGKEPLPGGGEVEVGSQTVRGSHLRMRRVPRRVALCAPEQEAS